MTTTEPIVPHASTQLSREQILQATSRCLSETGYDATTIRRIAGALDCAVGSIYRYFRDKRELLSIVTQQTLGPVAAMVEAGGNFEQSVRLYHQLMTHAPETYRLMFWLAGPGPESATPATAAPRLPEVVQRIVDGWAKQSGDAAVARRQWSILHGYVLQGRDIEETLAAVQELGVVTPAAANPTPQPRIVVTMTQPPAPEVPAVAASSAIADAERESMAAERRDDVVML